MNRTALALALSVLLAGCSNLAYYAQAVSGHVGLMRAARPIPDLLNDRSTEAGLRARLEKVSAIRDFASRELALPDNGSYRDYADIGRPYVVWNVFAAPEFSVEPRQWCMVFAGCVNYRGYYDESQARRTAAGLRDEGLDTYVGGVRAYSTLGYFDDPVLNTFLHLGEQEVARIVFHELAHQVAYAKDDSAFNESFAVTVENEGVHRWLAKHGTPEQRRGFETHQRRKLQFVNLVSEYRVRLRTAYAQDRPEQEQRREKARVIAEMKAAYAGLKASWGGYAGYDPWFEQGPNNAQIASVALYTRLVPAFEALLDRAGRDLPRFYQRVAALARLPKEERTAALQELAPPRM